MKGFIINCIFVILLPIIIILVAIFYYYPRNNNEIIPISIVIICCVGIIFIDIINIIRLYIKEYNLLYSVDKKLTSKTILKTIYNNFIWNVFVWYMPYTFSNRYKNVRYLTFCYALFLSFIIYCVGIFFTISFVYFYCKIFNLSIIENGNITFTSFLFGEGTIISFAALTFTIYALINTKLIKVQKETEIETVGKLFDVICEKLSTSDAKENKKFKNFWQSCHDKFIYIYDYTTALGQSSDEQNFKIYRNILCDFMTKYDVKYYALINNKEKNIKYYRTKGESFKKMEDSEINYRLVKEQDFYLSYLNAKLNDSGKSLIYYQSYDADHSINPKKDDFYENNISNREQEFYKGYEITDKETFISSGKKNCSSVLFVEDLGLVRFFVTNMFVIQFVLSKNSDKKPAPAGFISEDIILIERYKHAFEKYREEIVLGI